jgi:hypothetical protein
MSGEGSVATQEIGAKRRKPLKTSKVKQHSEQVSKRRFFSIKQFDLIRRIFANWAIITLGNFFVNYRRSTHFFAKYTRLCINFNKKWVGLQFG